MNHILVTDDCLEYMKTLPPNCVDALVTDPPAGISFMGKSWDGDKGGRTEWIAWMRDVMRECLRVMKPGAHGLVWSLPRTSHWTATALEDAGFEIRDCVYHIFGSGFPKSLDVSKAIDKAAGAERIITKHGLPKSTPGVFDNRNSAERRRFDSPSTEAAKEWQGWGTALKPAVECWWLIRKPCSEKTVAANVLKWGTGALNIDGSRVEADMSEHVRKDHLSKSDSIGYGSDAWIKKGIPHTQGRFPSHLILDEESGAMLDEQSGFSKTPGSVSRNARKSTGKYGDFGAVTTQCAGDSGGASRFFYCAKISARERNAGLEGMETKAISRSNGGQADVNRGKHVPRAEVGSGYDATTVAKNHHPTVKPQKLMRYLCKLVTPPGGLVLDPFTGSGSTGLAAISEGFRFLGIEREAEYAAIAEARLNGKETGHVI